MPITAPRTIYYTTFPSSPSDQHKSPNSVIPTIAPHGIDRHAVHALDSFELEQSPIKMPKRAADGGWKCPVSAKASQSSSTIKDKVQPLVEKIQLGCQRLDRKNPISLATADPTMPHLPPCTAAIEAVVQAAMFKPHAAGYAHASGTPEARRAIAMHHSFPERPLSPDHVIVTNGCSGALELALTSLLDPGTTVLVPQPGFPLYEEIAKSLGANVIHYKLDPAKRWECDLQHLHEIMMSHSDTVRALVVNNPSSHGSVFSEKHLEDLLGFAYQHQLPILSDEVYGHLTFGSNTFHPLAQVAARQGRHVPVITTSGLSKQFMVPGWRIGWVTFNDNIFDSLRPVEEGAHRLAQRMHGVSSLMQAAIPTLLSASTPGLADWKEKHRAAIERQGMLLCSSLNDCYCLKVGPPQGSMYALVSLFCERLDGSIQNDMDFAMRLLEEENVFVLPGSTFGAPDTIRVAFTSSEDTLQRATMRMSAFCRRHAKHGGAKVVGI